MNETLKKLTKARIELLTTQVFWGTLALRLRFREMPEDMRAQLKARGMIPTMAVDGVNLWYAPEFIDALSFTDTLTVIAHEIGHCMFDHIGRRGDRDPGKWNCAGDHVINNVLVEASFSYDGPGGWLCDPQYKNMTADQVYNLLPDDPEGAMCDIMQGDAEAESALQDEWKIAIAQAATLAQQEGKLPASMKRFVNDLLNPKTDWRTQLRRFVTEVSKDDYSWSRPNVMFVAHGLYLPTLHDERMGTIANSIDTSGSITQKMLDIFGGEMVAIRATVAPERMINVYCDVQVNRVDTFNPEDALVFEMCGGGGTDFRPPFKYLQDEDIKPACMIYFTDGYGPFPDTPPEYPVLWAMTTDVQPPWGEVVRVDLTGEV